MMGKISLMFVSSDGPNRIQGYLSLKNRNAFMRKLSCERDH